MNDEEEIRNSHGRFVHGHKVELPRDEHGHFVPKERIRRIAPWEAEQQPSMDTPIETMVEIPFKEDEQTLIQEAASIVDSLPPVSPDISMVNNAVDSLPVAVPPVQKPVLVEMPMATPTPTPPAPTPEPLKEEPKNIYPDRDDYAVRLLARLERKRRPF